MSDEMEVEDDVFLEEGVLYCTCGSPIDADDADGLIDRSTGREFVSCPTCDMKLFADSGHFRLDD